MQTELKVSRENILAFLPQLYGMLKSIRLTRRNHTYTAQAQDGHKEESAENYVSHGGIMANYAWVGESEQRSIKAAYST